MRNRKCTYFWLRRREKGAVLTGQGEELWSWRTPAARLPKDVWLLSSDNVPQRLT